MAAAIRKHPNEAILRAYTQGRLPLADAAELDRHIESCGECVRTLESIGSDTFSDLLRQPQTPFEGTKTPPREDVPAELRNHPRYEIGAHLGRGGMGVVYKAEHRMMRRPVALKLIRSDLLSSPAAVERFRREVQAAAKLAHTNIVTAHDAEEVAGVHFLVMEFVEGRTLDRVVAKRGPLPANIACNLARQASLGLDHAHAHGMVHRDIKPQNLIVTPKSKVKILDFGLAMWARPGEQKISGDHTALGTRDYAAPEQLTAAGEVDARADQYGLGATLFFLLSGEPPKRRGATGLPDDVPEGVRAIVAKMMAENPADRYESAKAIAEALAPWCSSAAIDESPTKPAWRKRFIFAGAAAAAIAIGLIAYKYSGSNGSRASIGSNGSNGSNAAIAKERNPASSQPPKTTPAPEWHSLLPVIDPNSRLVVAGDWQRIEGELTVKAARGARIMVPVNPPGEYDFRVEFTRKTGSQSVGVIVCKNGYQALFELDAWDKHLSGFQNIGGRTLEQLQPQIFHPLTNGRRYTILVEVRRNSIAGFLDGQEVARHRSNGSDLAIDERFWAIPNPKNRLLGLAAWNSETVFHAVDMRIVSLLKK